MLKYDKNTVCQESKSIAMSKENSSNDREAPGIIAQTPDKHANRLAEKKCDLPGTYQQFRLISGYSTDPRTRSVTTWVMSE